MEEMGKRDKSLFEGAAMASSVRIVLLGSLVGGVVFVAGSQASAANGWGGDWFWGRSLYYSYERDNVPYFAMYPPVYYSLPVPRTYGYSPFAYPPGTMTPELVSPPKVIENPHAPMPPDPKPEEVPAKPAVQRTARAPKVIVNPYVSDVELSQAASD
jgi:hypothetical protein